MYTHLVIAAGFNVGDMLFYAILFLLLMWIVKIFAWKPITKMMQDRSTKIANDIDSAEKSRNDAAKLAKERADALQNSHDEATKIVSDAEQAGQKRRDTIISDAQNDAKGLKDKAHKDIEQECEYALASTKDDVADLSIEIASKIIKKNLNADDQKALIDSYIEGLGNPNESR
ncbi:F0F1 ATP synthase subunit B [Fructilactobacillus fructivorans]|uniref:F0F1 ATP synthase subunit B n=1 Tax=Fructilactobacillus fructivorans TaxID=1614 RepID=UPI00070509CC|nr:F0F1 ATP synthase subunit B [Fructilactobacillus fructivorans]KRN43235.1 F0F1 ATP synthase subunit B [Fructilactobacillus fructivorans]